MMEIAVMDVQRRQNYNLSLFRQFQQASMMQCTQCNCFSNKKLIRILREKTFIF